MSAQDKADIEKLVASYVAGSGGPAASVDDLRKVFYDKAAFIGHFPPTNEEGSQFILGDIEGLYGFVSKDAAGPKYEYKITDLLIAKEGDAALVVFEEKDWHGYDFTDYFVALKIGGRWWITAKVRLYMYISAEKIYKIDFNILRSSTRSSNFNSDYTVSTIVILKSIYVI